MQRKIIQTEHNIAPNETGGMISVIALCDDGTVWHGLQDRETCFKWYKLPNIPQDKKPLIDPAKEKAAQTTRERLGYDRNDIEEHFVRLKTENVVELCHRCYDRHVKAKNH